MKREEAIKLLKQYQGYEPMSPDGETLKHSFDLTDETVDALLTVLRPVSREKVEKVWRGEWQMVSNGSGVCSECHRRRPEKVRNQYGIWPYRHAFPAPPDRRPPEGGDADHA